MPHEGRLQFTSDFGGTSKIRLNKLGDEEYICMKAVIGGNSDGCIS